MSRIRLGDFHEFKTNKHSTIQCTTESRCEIYRGDVFVRRRLRFAVSDGFLGRYRGSACGCFQAEWTWRQGRIVRIRAGFGAQDGIR